MLVIMLVGWAVVLPILVVAGLYGASVILGRRDADDVGMIDITAFATEFVRAAGNGAAPTAKAPEVARAALVTDASAATPPLRAGY